MKLLISCTFSFLMSGMNVNNSRLAVRSNTAARPEHISTRRKRSCMHALRKSCVRVDSRSLSPLDTLSYPLTVRQNEFEILAVLTP